MIKRRWEERGEATGPALQGLAEAALAAAQALAGVAELLPTVDVAVFDEAPQLVDAGVQFLGTTLATGQAIDLGRDLLAVGLAHARGLQPWNDLQAGIEQADDDRGQDVGQYQRGCLQGKFSGTDLSH